MMDSADPPIVEEPYIHGPTVVDIGDVRVARGMSRRAVSTCGHQRLVYDLKERRIWCKDCETNIEGFDAFQIIVLQWHAAHDELDRQRKIIEDAKTSHLTRIAAKRMDALWCRKNMVPTCPHCGVGLLPEDTDRLGAISKEIEIARRKRKAERST